MDGVVVALGRVQRLEHKHRRALARAHAVGPGIKGFGEARGGFDGKGRIRFDGQVYEVRAAHHRHGAFAVTQAAAGLVQGRQHGGTGRIHAGGRAAPVFQITQAGHHVGGHVEHINLLRLLGKSQRDGVLEQAHRAGPNKNAHVFILQGRAAVARVVQRRERRFKKHALGRVQQGGIGWRKPKPFVVKPGNIRKVGGFPQLGVVKGQPGGLEYLPGFLLPRLRHGHVFVRARGQILPETFHIRIIAHAHGHADDGHRGIARHAQRGGNGGGAHPRRKTRLRPHAAFGKQPGQGEHARPAFVQQRVQAHQQQRIAAHFKKALIRPGLHLGHHLAPHFANRRKHGVFPGWASCPACSSSGHGPIRRNKRLTGQPFAVGLAGGAQGDVVHHKIPGRMHIFGQQGRKPGAYACKVKARPGLGQQKSLKRGIIAYAAHPHHGLRNASAPPQSRLHFAQLNAEPPNFHLIVIAAKVFNAPINIPAPQVARAEHAVARRKRIGHETLLGEVRPVGIALGHLNARNINFAGHANGRGVPVVVKNIQPGVGHGAADGHYMGGRWRAGLPRNVHRGLRGAIKIVQFRPQQCVETRHQLTRQGLAAGEHIPQRGKAPRLLRVKFQMVQKSPQHRRHKMHHRNTVLCNGRHNGGGVLFRPWSKQGKACPLPRPPEQLPHGNIKGNCGLLQHHIARPDGEPRLHPAQAIAHAALRYLHALGFAGGAGSKDDIGGGLRCERRPVGRVRGHGGGHETAAAQGLRPRHKHAPPAVGKLLRKPRRAHNHTGTKVFKHAVHAFTGHVGGKGHIGRPGPQHGKNAGQHVQRTVKTHAGGVALPKALLLKPRAQGFHAGVKIRVAQGVAIGLHHGGGAGCAGCLGTEAGIHVRGQIKRFCRVVPGGKTGKLALGQHIQIGNANIAPGKNGIGKPAQPLRHKLNGFWPEKLRAIFQMHRKSAVRLLPEIETQVKLAGIVGQGKRFHAQRFAPKIRPGGVFQGHKNVEHGVAGDVPFNIQRVDKAFKGAGLRGQGFLQGCVHMLRQSRESLAAVNLCADHKRVDEQAENALRLRPFTVGRGAAENDIALPRVAVQEGIHQGQQHGKHRHARLTGKTLQGEAAFVPKIEGQHGARKTLLGRPGEIQGKAQAFRQGREGFLQFFKPFGFAPRFPHGAAGVIQVQGPPHGRAPAQHSRIGAVQLARDNFRRPAVKNDVVKTEQQHMPAVLLAKQGDPRQRFLHPEALAHFLKHFLIGLDGKGSLAALQHQPAGSRHKLLRRFFGHAQAQGIVPFFQQGQSLLQGGGINNAAQPGREGNNIGPAIRLQFLQKPDALLRR